MRLGRIAATIVGLGFAAPATAHEYKHGTITIIHPCARATPVKVGGVYVTFKNTGNAPDRLIKVASPEAEKAEMHETRIESGVAMMRAVAAVEIKPGAKVEFKPGGLHIMLMGLPRPLKEGGTVPLTLTFEKAGTFEIRAMIEKAGSMCGH